MAIWMLHFLSLSFSHALTQMNSLEAWQGVWLGQRGTHAGIRAAVCVIHISLSLSVSQSLGALHSFIARRAAPAPSAVSVRFKWTRGRTLSLQGSFRYLGFYGSPAPPRPRSASPSTFLLYFTFARWIPSSSLL